MEDPKKTVTSPKWSINLMDALRGLLMAVGTAVLVVIQDLIDQGIYTFDWKIIGKSALAAGVFYLLKNFFTGPSKKIEITNQEAKESTAPPAAK